MAGIEYAKDYVARVNLKTGRSEEERNDKEIRKKLINFCLNKKDQYLAIGWSGCYWSWKDENKKNHERDINSFEDFYNYVKKDAGKTPAVLNLFYDTCKDDLFWTRDLDGNYWICRAKMKAKAKLDEELDIGAVIPVEAYNCGMEVP